MENTGIGPKFQEAAGIMTGSMKVAVCIKQVMTRETHVRPDAAGTGVREDGASWALSEPDSYALEEALRLRDRLGGEVVAVSAGPGRVTQILREALARGADRAIHVESDQLGWADSAATATALTQALETESADLILTGLQSDDQGAGQVGVMLAERLGVDHASLVVAVEPGDGEVRVKRELEGGRFQWLTLPLPALLTVQSGINQLRYATLKGIMAAKKKELRTISASSATAASRIVGIRVPNRTKQTTMLTGSASEIASQLADVIRRS